MNELRIARPYAKSLLDLAKEKEKVEEVSADMTLFVKTAEETPAFARILKSPIISHSKKREILNAVFKGKVGKITLAFFDILCRKKREQYLFFIAKEFGQQYRILKGIQIAEVITTLPLLAAQKESFVAMVKDVTSASKIEMKETIDKALIGGFILKIDDLQVDQSIKSKLNHLQNKFKDNSYTVKY